MIVFAPNERFKPGVLRQTTRPLRFHRAPVTGVVTLANRYRWGCPLSY